MSKFKFQNSYQELPPVKIMTDREALWLRNFYIRKGIIKPARRDVNSRLN
jgi:hypothetical protein